MRAAAVVFMVLAAIVSGATAAHAQAPAGVAAAAPMSEARAGHTSIAFEGGLVMVCGGTTGGPASKTCESYDDTKGAWAPQVQMSNGRAYHAVTYLSDLQMYFLVGGLTSADPASGQQLTDMYSYDQQSSKWTLQQMPQMMRGKAFFGMNSAIFYNVPQQQQATVLAPAVGPGTDVDVFKMVMTQSGSGGSILWFTGKPIPHTRDHHSVVPIIEGTVNKGKVLVVGGYAAEAEIYDPLADAWTAAGTLNVLRGRQAATVLADGRVMVCGGEDAAHVPLASCELGDLKASPVTWTATGDLLTARRDFVLVTLQNGKVYAAGGAGTDGKPIAGTGELWDPASPTWAATVPLTAPRAEPTATGLGNGKVLVCGGKDAAGGALASCELYQPQQLCAPASQKCENNQAYVCDFPGMSWMKVADCLNGCKDGTCVGESCTPGTRRCKTAVSRDTVEVCADSGDHWIYEETCDKGCEHDSVTAWCTGTPRPDAGYIDVGPQDTGAQDTGCVPDCAGAMCGAGDGCGGMCKNGACPDDMVCDQTYFMCTVPEPDAGQPQTDAGGGGGGKDAGTGGGAQPGGDGAGSGGGGCSCSLLGI